MKFIKQYKNQYQAKVFYKNSLSYFLIYSPKTILDLSWTTTNYISFMVLSSPKSSTYLMKVSNIVLHMIWRGILNFLPVKAGNEMLLADNFLWAVIIGSTRDFSSNHGSLRCPPFHWGATVWITHLESKS